MFSKTLTHAGHIRHFIVRARHASGWEVRVEEDRQVVRQALYHDWHRLERALGAIEREVGELVRNGWQPAAETSTPAHHA
jgi:hypothetical protein